MSYQITHWSDARRRRLEVAISSVDLCQHSSVNRAVCQQMSVSGASMTECEGARTMTDEHTYLLSCPLFS